MESGVESLFCCVTHILTFLMFLWGCCCWVLFVLLFLLLVWSLAWLCDSRYGPSTDKTRTHQLPLFLLSLSSLCCNLLTLCFTGGVDLATTLLLLLPFLRTHTHLPMVPLQSFVSFSSVTLPLSHSGHQGVHDCLLLLVKSFQEVRNVSLSESSLGLSVCGFH